MNRVILAGLAIVLLRDCELAGPRPSPGKVAGTWGGDNAGLIADDTSAHVHIGCTYGNVHQPIVADAHGRFDLPGEQDITAHPVDRGILHPARFSGSVLGQLADELEGYKMTKSSLHFPVDRPLPKALVKKLIAVRLADRG